MVTTIDADKCSHPNCKRYSGLAMSPCDDCDDLDSHESCSSCGQLTQS